MARPANLSDGVVTFTARKGSKPSWCGSALRGIHLGGPSSYLGDGTFGRFLDLAVQMSNSEGNPSAPSLAVVQHGFWRFRWCLTAGTHTISINVKQVSGLTPRPTLVIKSNSAIGVVADVTGTAPVFTGWSTIGPVSVTAPSAGVVWVELWNNLVASYDTAYFDHIVTT